MTEPFHRTRQAESFSSTQRKVAELVAYLAVMVVVIVGGHQFWNWVIPLDPAWTPPPRNQTFVAGGAFASSTDALQPRGYDFFNLSGGHLRLRCTPYADASPMTKDNCLAARGRLGDYAGQRVDVRYYELPGVGDGEPQRILLSANAGRRWILHPQDQAARLAADAASEKSREVFARTQYTITGAAFVAIIGVIVFGSFRRKTPATASTSLRTE
ncbi:hypothetical protein [Caulobacter hibisci]|uniref:DUF3592 domain-containing protein n=1 Tax=Caulobacter hibisci TaxID=2035993 RepID=A0ABS0T579_9CAUL|nr:hypothetical protein [Caulobacter hibisci]MBI1686641.1 hypothetical protein [Caulobacter hibisci]